MTSTTIPAMEETKKEESNKNELPFLLENFAARLLSKKAIQ